MWKKLFILFIMLLFYNSGAEIMTTECEKPCKCDMVKNLRRALCSGRKLVGIEANVHHTADILDVSYNMIRELRASIFQEIHLTNLQQFNISYNILGNNINIDAFNGMKNLNILDMSYNGIGSLIPIWFKDMPNLKELYMAGNHLEKINIHLEAKFLEILDISGCKLNELKPDTFLNIPNLKRLDISKNSLQSLSADVLAPLINLRYLNMYDNTLFICNPDVSLNLLSHVKKYNIEFIGPCKTSIKPVEKFQKMINDETLETNTWTYDDPQHDNKTVECNSSIPIDEDNYLLKIIKLSPTIILTGIFFYGILVGLVIGCVYEQCSLIGFKKSKQISEEIEMNNETPNQTLRSRSNIRLWLDRHPLNNNIRRSVISYSNRFNDEYRQSLIDSEYELAESTPIPNRKTLN